MYHSVHCAILLAQEPSDLDLCYQENLSVLLRCLLLGKQIFCVDYEIDSCNLLRHDGAPKSNRSLNSQKNF